MNDNHYDLAKAWEKMEENFNSCSGMVPVQGISLNPEYTEGDEAEDPGFDYIVANHKLNNIFKNVGSKAQSAEFGGNDVWLILGNYPIRIPGETATLLFAGDDTYKGRDGFYDIFKRTLLPNGEYEDKTIDSGDYEPMLAKALNMRPMKETDNSDEAIARRDREETTSPMDRIKTLKVDGHAADLLGREINKTGNVEWTDSFQGDGPYLPIELEDYILKVAGNTSEEPFKLRFVKYGTSHPQEGREAPIYVEYEQDVASDPNEFGKRDMDESTTTDPIEELRKLIRVEDLDIEVDIYLGIVKIGALVQGEDGEWSIIIQKSTLYASYPTKEEAFEGFIAHISNDD